MTTNNFKFTVTSESSTTLKKTKETLRILKLKPHKNKPYTIKKTQKYIRRQLKTILKKGEEAKISTLSGIGWRSNAGGWYSKNKVDDIEVFDPATQYGDYELEAKPRVHQILITIRKKPSKKGGSDAKNYNNCLYYCLKDFGVNLGMFDKPYKLKKAIYVERDQPIHIKKIPFIEKKLRINIVVTGDFIYNSPRTYPRTIYLKLRNGHYSIVDGNKQAKKLISSVSHKEEKHIVVYKRINDEYVGYDGETKTYDFQTILDSIKDSNSKYAFVESSSDDLTSFYNKFMTDAEHLKSITKGKVNVLINGNIKKTALKLFYDYIKLFDFEELEAIEEEWIQNAFLGGIIYCKTGEFENVKCYDINSMYPSILQSDKFLIPTKKGTFNVVTNETFKSEPFIRYGIYRCKVTGDINHKLFKVNKLNYYTSYDLQTARQLGYEIDLIEDGQPNFLQYLKRMPSKSIFGDYVQQLYKLKQEHPENKMIKQLLNVIWGALCQKNTFKCSINNEDISSSQIQEVWMHNDRIFFTCRKEKSVFKHCYARLAPFLTSYGRKSISEQMQPIEKDIIRVHTDGFICHSDVSIETSNDIGTFKLEYEADKVVVHNVNHIEKL